MTRLLLATVLIALLSTGAAGQEHGAESGTEHAMTQKLEDTPHLTVRGDAEFDRPADQVHLSVGVVSEAASAEASLAENTSRMKAVVAALDGLGLADDEIEAGRFQIRPKYASRPRQPKAEWKPEIIGYETTNTLAIKTKKLDLAGRVIMAATDAGANTVEITEYDLADERAYRAQAIRKATAYAIADAEVIADAASLRLVRIISVNLGSVPSPRGPERMAVARMAMADGGAPPLGPGNVTIRANVTILYEIAPRDTQ